MFVPFRSSLSYIFSYAGELLPSQEVYIKVYGKDHFQTFLIGEVTLNTEDLCKVKGDVVEGWHPLEITKQFKSKKASRIFVRLTYPKVFSREKILSFIS